MKRVIQLGNKITSAFVILLTLLVVFVPYIEISQNINEHLVHFLFVLIVSGLIGLLLGSRVVLFTSFGCAMVLAIFLKSASNTQIKDPKANSEAKITVAHINLSLITDTESIDSILNTHNIDILSFQEYTPDWANIIPYLIKETYPYQYIDVRIDLFGKAIFSKHKIISTAKHTYSDMPNLEINIAKSHKNFKVISSYIMPALEKTSKFKAKFQLEQLAEVIKNKHTDLIVMGEFNQVYWTDDILSFRTKAKLNNSRRSINPSNSKMPYDHIFYTGDLECLDFMELIDISKNHIGCLGTFQLKKVIHQ